MTGLASRWRTHTHNPPRPTPPLPAQVNQCSPAPFAAVIYFCTYMLVVVYLLLQLIIGIILENIEVGVQGVFYKRMLNTCLHEGLCQTLLAACMSH